MDNMWFSWFAGLVDGEGCFQLSGRSDNVVPMLSIQMRYDDEDMLKEIKGKLGMGKLYFYNPHGRQRSRTSRLCIWRKEDCQRLVELFDRIPLRSRKKNDYAVWREAVLFMKEWRPSRDKQDKEFRMNKLLSFRDRLSSARDIELKHKV